jgi:hypothetical protein
LTAGRSPAENAGRGDAHRRVKQINLPVGAPVFCRNCYAIQTTTRRNVWTSTSSRHLGVSMAPVGGSPRIDPFTERRNEARRSLAPPALPGVKPVTRFGITTPAYDGLAMVVLGVAGLKEPAASGAAGTTIVGTDWPARFRRNVRDEMLVSLLAAALSCTGRPGGPRHIGHLHKAVPFPASPSTTPAPVIPTTPSASSASSATLPRQDTALGGVLPVDGPRPQTYPIRKESCLTDTKKRKYERSFPFGEGPLDRAG